MSQSLESAYRATAEQLILQTSEGPRETLGEDSPDRNAARETDVPAAEATPEANPIRCT